MKAEKIETKYVLMGTAAAVILAGAALIGVLLRTDSFSNPNPNLAMQKGVKAVCDSVEQETLSADRAIDGNDEDRTSRWSSENNREDASHFIMLEFPKEISVSFVVLKWERANVISYALEGSLDGTAYEELAVFDTAPETLVQEIVLAEPVQTRFLRLSTYEVSKEAADYSDLYQNVSLYEFEVYADKPAAYQLKTPVIETAADGKRTLVAPEAPAGFAVTLIGADLEQVIGADGTVYETIQDKEVTVGYRVEDTRGREETREVSFTVTVPAADAALSDDGRVAEKAGGETAVNERPDKRVFPAVAEWKGGRGDFVLRESARIVVDAEAAGEDAAQALWEIAALMNESIEKDGSFHAKLTVCRGTLADTEAGDIYLGYAKEANGLGDEGYTCDITDKCVIKAEAARGVRWGTVTLLQLFCAGELSEEISVPQGQIRDYPLYEVRGFGIDVARKAVSLDMLYAIMETMSRYKMNDLAIHLNDNEILATSGLTASAEQAMTAESAFRLESDVLGVQAGREASSPQEYVYTREELAQLIATAKAYGVTVVPEIDTPAHSLAITGRYPEYALRTSAESADQIDLGNDEAVSLVESLWQEALDREKGAFRDAGIVNIGMDEYYGDGEQYRQYLVKISELVQRNGKTARLWGSLGNMGGTTAPSAADLQMNLWSTVWADPMEMYESGYSLINMQNNHLYIIPGGGYDRLDIEDLYENWTPERFYDYNRIETVPAYSPQMLGAAYMIWNDMCGRLDVGICEYDLYERFLEPLGVLSAKLWGMQMPEDYDSVQKPYLYDTAEAVEPDYEIQIKVWLDEDGTAGQAQNERQMAQIIAAGDCAYGEWAFYAVEPETGKVGFAREGKTYTFDYTLPRGEWVNLKLEGKTGRTTLYAEGRKVDSLGSDEPFEEHATFVFPLQRVGEETGQFDGEVELAIP
ncbi:MAG: family 20 glycosylhydrolase [Bacteroidales bacterium]|nr:family 20 glycosylhydrolase [Bacteroidales bacterium]MCM1416988.1 family 20 glycosylhydrolase [bacterium]MCM1422827.1 family 20 glycosylhydrolase [bacterium]